MSAKQSIKHLVSLIIRLCKMLFCCTSCTYFNDLSRKGISMQQFNFKCNTDWIVIKKDSDQQVSDALDFVVTKRSRSVVFWQGMGVTGKAHTSLLGGIQGFLGRSYEINVKIVKGLVCCMPLLHLPFAFCIIACPWPASLPFLIRMPEGVLRHFF